MKNFLQKLMVIGLSVSLTLPLAYAKGKVGGGKVAISKVPPKVQSSTSSKITTRSITPPMKKKSTKVIAKPIKKDKQTTTAPQKIPKDILSKIQFEKHIFNAEINKKGQLTGGHSIHGNVRVDNSSKKSYSNGVYDATITMVDPKNPSNILSKHNNTMFPDSWSRAKIVDEVSNAYDFKIDHTGRWTATTPSGISITGIDKTVYPLVDRTHR